jgi:hypothetical protein
MLRRDVPRFEISHRARVASLRPIAQRHYDEAYQLAAARPGRLLHRDQHGVARRVGQDLLLLADQALARRVRPQGHAQVEPGSHRAPACLASVLSISSWAV